MDLCEEALSAIAFAEKENLPKTAKTIRWECSRHDCSPEMIVRKTFIREVGERIVGEKADDHTKEKAGREPAAEIMLKIGNPKWIFWFCKYVPGLSKEVLDKFTELIMNTADSCDASSFAIDAKGLSKENINQLARVVLKSENPGSAMRFARYVHGVSLDLRLCFADIVLKSKDPEWAYFFAVGITGISDKLIEDFAEIVINSKNPRYAFLFAKFLCMRMSQDILKKLISTVEAGKDEDLEYFQGRDIKDLSQELKDIFMQK